MEVTFIFTDSLKQERKNKGVIQEEMAALLGIAKATYSRKENNLIPFSHDELIRIKEFLKLSDTQFMGIFFKK